MTAPELAGSHVPRRHRPVTRRFEWLWSAVKLVTPARALSLPCLGPYRPPRRNYRRWNEARRSRWHSAKVSESDSKSPTNQRQRTHTQNVHGSVQGRSKAQHHRGRMAHGPVPPKPAAQTVSRVALDTSTSHARRGPVGERVVGERRAAQGERVRSYQCLVSQSAFAFRSIRCPKRRWSRRRCPDTMNVWSRGTRGAHRASDGLGGRSFSVFGDEPGSFCISLRFGPVARRVIVSRVTSRVG